MYARVTRFKSEPARIDEGVRNIKDNVIPSAKKITGFKRGGGYRLAGPQDRNGFGVTLFGERGASSVQRRGREEASRAGSVDRRDADHGCRALRGRRPGLADAEAQDGIRQAEAAERE